MEAKTKRSFSMPTREENVQKIKTMQKNLKQLREEKNRSIEELSEISGISPRILKNIEEKESYNFTVEILYTLCRIYGVQMSKIFLPLG